MLSEDDDKRSQVYVESVGGDERAQVRGFSFQLTVGES